jgi:hypothetical protein
LAGEIFGDGKMKRKIKLSSKDLLKQNIESILEHIRLLIIDFQNFEKELTKKLNNLEESINEFEENENK